MAIYHPSYVLNFGINKGYTLAEVYSLAVNYVEWLIEYIPDFEIEISEFESLPQPLRRNTSGDKKSTFFTTTLPPNEVSKVINTGPLESYEFKFSEKIVAILKAKKLGIYIPPKWEKAIIERISIEDLLNNIQK